MTQWTAGHPCTVLVTGDQTWRQTDVKLADIHQDQCQHHTSHQSVPATGIYYHHMLHCPSALPTPPSPYTIIFILCDQCTQKTINAKNNLYIPYHPSQNAVDITVKCAYNCKYILIETQFWVMCSSNVLLIFLIIFCTTSRQEEWSLIVICYFADSTLGFTASKFIPAMLNLWNSYDALQYADIQEVM